MRTMEQALAVFSIGDLATFKNVLITLQQNGKTINEAIKFIIEQEQLRARKQAIWKQCPVCGDIMVLQAVNDSPCTQVGGDYVAQYFCEQCGEAEFFSKDEADEVATEYLKKAANRVSDGSGCQGCGGK